MPIVAPENYTWLGGIQICARQQWQNQMKSYVSGMLLTEQDAHWDVLPVKSLLFFAASTSRSTPNVDCGDYVIVINADKIVITGDQNNKKSYYSHSQYPGGLRVRTTRVMREQYTVEWVEKAIKGMLPHTRLGDVMRTHLYVYTGSEHPHQAQKPVELKIKG